MGSLLGIQHSGRAEINGPLGVALAVGVLDGVGVDVGMGVLLGNGVGVGVPAKTIVLSVVPSTRLSTNKIIPASSCPLGMPLLMRICESMGISV